KIEHFGDRGGLLHRPATQCLSDSGDAAVKGRTALGGEPAKELSLACRAGVFDPQVKTSASQRVADPSFLIRRKHDKRKGARLYHAQFGNAELPSAEHFKQHGFEGRTDLVEF